MTPFEMWCNDNGFDPKGEFVLTRSDGIFEAGEVVKAYHFYDSGEVLFIKSVGDLNRVSDVSFERLTQHKKEAKQEMSIQEDLTGNFHHSPKKIKWDEIHESIDLVKWDDGKCLFGHFDQFGNRLFTPMPKLNFPNGGFSSEVLFYRKDSSTSTDRALLPKPDHPKSLRDEFAMSALSGLMFTKKILHPMGNSDASYLAKMAYQIADAMLEARK